MVSNRQRNDGMDGRFEFIQHNHRDEEKKWNKKKQCVNYHEKLLNEFLMHIDANIVA